MDLPVLYKAYGNRHVDLENVIRRSANVTCPHPHGSPVTRELDTGSQVVGKHYAVRVIRSRPTGTCGHVLGTFLAKRYVGVPQLQGSHENVESETKKGIYPRICPELDQALRSCGLLLRQAVERAETQHQINGMDAHYYTILE